MNSFMKHYIMSKRNRDMAYGRGYDGNDYGRGEFAGEFRGDYESDYARTRRGGGYGRGRGSRDYADDDYDMPDGRRGVKGTGPYGIGGRRHYPRRDRAYDGADYGEEEEMKLTKSEMRDWKESLENSDGTKGEHFSYDQIIQAIQAFGFQPKGYTDKDICLAANVIYSDIGQAFKQFIPPEKEVMVYVKAAKLALDDPDASVHGKEKLAAYYYAIVDDE